MIGEFYKLLDEERKEEPVSIFNKDVYEQYLAKVHDPVETDNSKAKELLRREEGVKHDEGKPRMSLLPPKALRHVAEVMTFGADKYGEHNYLGGMDHLRLLDAMLRHINAHISGQDMDEESGKYHIAHAAACTLMLLEYLINDLGTDNRWEGYK